MINIKWLNKIVLVTAIVAMCLCVTSSFAQNKTDSSNSNRRRSLATSGGNVINNRNRSIGANSNNNNQQKNTNKKTITTNANKNNSNNGKQTSNNNRATNITTTRRDVGQSRKTSDSKKTGAGKNAATQGQLKMVDKTMIEVLRTRKVEYDEEKKASSPTVIILNSKHISPEKSLIERESILVRQEKEQMVAQEISKIPPDMLEFLGDLY